MNLQREYEEERAAAEADAIEEIRREYRDLVEPIIATTIASSLFIHREHVAKHVAAAFDAVDAEEEPR